MRGRPTIRREQDYGRHCGGNWRRASEAQVNSQIQLRKKEEKPYNVIRTNRARERKKLRLGLQERQQEVANYWSTHEGETSADKERVPRRLQRADVPHQTDSGVPIGTPARSRRQINMPNANMHGVLWTDVRVFPVRQASAP